MVTQFNANLKICLSIGYPIKSSKSPSIHNAGYKALGIDDQFIYARAEVKSENLEAAIKGVRALGIRGVSVTMPHKQQVMNFLDKLDETAEKIGAVNTVINDNGTLIGFNTDSIGAIKALKNRTNLSGKKVGIIGAGGASRAIIYGLVKEQAKVKIFNRTKDRAKELAQEFNCSFVESLDEFAMVDILINATSVGMNEDVSPISKHLINQDQVILDVVYLPKETRLIKDAKDKGAQVVYGYEMLLYQGAEQFKLYTGYEAPVKVMQKVLEESIT